MTIRAFNASDFDKIAKSNTIPKKNDDISDEQLRYLYEKALEEFKICEGTLIQLQIFLSEIFCNHELLLSDETNNFFMFMNTAINCILPSILEGDYDETFKYCNEELTEDDLDEARLELYNKLYDKYLK